MRKNQILFLTLLLLLVGCESTEIPAPETQVDCQLDYSNHPKHLDYSNLIDQFTGSEFVGLNLLVDHPQEGLWIGSSGWADIENEVPMTPCHLHYASSINKSYIAVIILQMEEEGKLSIEDPLSKYIESNILSRIPNGEEFTIRHLLQCRSGMPDVFESEFLLDFLNNPTQQYEMEELITYLYGVKPVSSPGDKYYYGDGNFILLSMVIEAIDGDLQNAFEERIFQRLGANDSYLIDTPAELPVGMTASYWDRHGNGVLENVSEYQSAIVAGLEGADGLVTSVFDLNLFVRGLGDGTLLSPSSYTKMLETLDIPEGDSNQNYAGYGLGIARVQITNEVWYGSFGNNVGSSALMLYNPSHDVSIVAAQNMGTFFNDDLKAIFFGYLIFSIEEALF